MAKECEKCKELIDFIRVGPDQRWMPVNFLYPMLIRINKNLPFVGFDIRGYKVKGEAIDASSPGTILAAAQGDVDSLAWAYIPHWTTCPENEEFRKKTKERKAAYRSKNQNRQHSDAAQGPDGDMW